MISSQRVSAHVNDAFVEVNAFKTDETMTITINGATCSFKTYYGAPSKSAYEDTILALKEAVEKL